MSERRPRSLLPRRRRAAAIALVLAVLALAGAACGDRASTGAGPSPQGAMSPGGWSGAQVTPAIHKPDVTLVDSSGAPFSLRRATDGYVTLLYVGYTHCPDVCPLQMATVASALKKVPPDVAAKIKVVFLTADPARDTPAHLREWLDRFNPSFIGLTGSQAAIGAALKALYMAPVQKEDLGGGNYGVSHAAYVLAFTTDDLAHLIYPEGVTADDWARDLEKLVRRGWTDQ